MTTPDNPPDSLTDKAQAFYDRIDGATETVDTWKGNAFKVFKSAYKENKDKPKLTLEMLNAPKAYDLQREIIDHPAQRKVINAGRQVGKTTTAGLMALEEFFRGGRVLYCATTQEQSDGVWEYLYEWAIPTLRQFGVYVNESKRIINGNRKGLGLGRIRVKTGFKPDVLRGEKADLLILDECAYLDEKAWTKVGAPMLATTKGRAVFISTPNRRNWFFTLYQRGLDPLEEDWQTWEFPTTASPYVTPEAFAALIKDMNEEDLKQEVYAKFLENEGSVFRNIDAAIYKNPSKAPVKAYESDFVFGVDWGQSKDYTVITVLDVRVNKVVEIYRFNKLAWFDQRARIKWLYEKWNKVGKVHIVLVELNSIGSPNAEALYNEGLPIDGFMMTGRNKAPLIESLALAIERADLTIPDDPVLKGELLAYERKVSPRGSRTYSAPSGLHDDTVVSLAITWFAATELPYDTRVDLPIRERIGDY